MRKVSVSTQRITVLTVARPYIRYTLRERYIVKEESQSVQIATGDWRVQKPKYGYQGRRADKGAASIAITLAATIRLLTQTVFRRFLRRSAKNLK